MYCKTPPSGDSELNEKLPIAVVKYVSKGIIKCPNLNNGIKWWRIYVTVKFEGIRQITDSLTK